MLAVVYVLHFSRPYWRNCQHYVGYTKRELEERMAEHRSGNGSRTCKFAKEHGIEFKIVRTETFGSVKEARQRELEIKRTGGGKSLCPICQRRS